MNRCDNCGEIGPCSNWGDVSLCEDCFDDADRANGYGDIEDFDPDFVEDFDDDEDDPHVIYYRPDAQEAT